MSTSSLFMLIPFLIVAFATALTVLRKRKQLERTRHVHREPHFELDTAAKKDPRDDFEIVPVKKSEEPAEFTHPILSPSTSAQTENASSYSSAASNKDIMIVLHAIADPEKLYAGYELLQAMLTAGFRFGKMNIFHRHEEMNGRGSILFSLASMVEPGTFEMNKMGGFSTPGLVLFMKTGDLQDPLKAFEILQNTAQQLVDDLGGEVCDEKRMVLSADKVAYWRSQMLGNNAVLV
jgi:cell division protein ZipA